MTPMERLQKFHTDETSIPRSGQCFWLVEPHFPSSKTNQKAISQILVCYFRPWFSDVILRGNQWWHHKMLAVFSITLQNCRNGDFCVAKCWDCWCIIHAATILETPAIPGKKSSQGSALGKNKGSQALETCEIQGASMYNLWKKIFLSFKSIKTVSRATRYF